MQAADGDNPGDSPSDPAARNLDSAMKEIDERAGYAEPIGSREATDQDRPTGSIDSAGDRLCSEIASGTRFARLALLEAVPRVSDSIATQQIEAAIGLLDRSLRRTLDLKAWLNTPK